MRDGLFVRSDSDGWDWLWLAWCFGDEGGLGLMGFLGGTKRGLVGLDEEREGGGRNVTHSG